MADVGRLQCERALQVVFGHRQGLLRQRVHQVEVEIVEAGVLRQLDRRLRLAAVVDAAEPFQAAVIETLDAEAEAIDAGVAVALEAAVLGGARIGLQGDFAPRGEAQPRTGALQEAVDEFRRHQARGTTAEKHRLHGAAPDQRQVEVEVGQQRIDVGGERQLAAALVRVEIAVRAFAHAPRNVDVQRQRRWGKDHVAIVPPVTAGNFALLL